MSNGGNAGIAAHITSFDYRQEEWINQSPCRSVDPEWFYVPDMMRGVSKRKYENRALTICEGCPVRKKCLDMAFYTNDKYAIMGGTTPDMRKAMRR